jgi:ketosteroid isomerase-like protein
MAAGVADGRRTAGVGGESIVSATSGDCKFGFDSLQVINELFWRKSNMKSASLLTVLLCATALVAPGQDASDSATKSKIAALEGAWNQAYKSGDAKALDALLDNGIVLVNDDGSVQTKAEFLASVKPSGTQAGSQEQQIAPESMTVHVFGNTAIATGVFRAKGVEGRKSYVRRERFIDTWIYQDGHWACVATNATPILH